MNCLESSSLHLFFIKRVLNYNYEKNNTDIGNHLLVKREHSIFAGELSGHFYYKENSFAESSFITAALILNLLDGENKPLSELIAPLKKYFQSGELNSELKDKEAKIKEIEEKFKDAEKTVHLDGLSVYYKDWWFNIRPSNTEPLLRLNLEADTEELMQEKKELLLGIIRS